MSELLLEYYCEELPYFVQQTNIVDLFNWIKKKIEEALGTTVLGKYYSAPTRMTFTFENIPQNTKAVSRETRGPRTTVPEKAIQGFMKTHNINSKEQLEINNDGYYIYIENIAPKSAPSVLKEVIEDATKTFIWPRSMRWGETQLHWIRPIKNILCLLDGKVIPAQIENIVANNITYGHKFMYNKPITIQSAEDYGNLLLKNKVILSRGERKHSVKEAINNLVEPLNLSLIEDDTLVENIISLIEYPQIYIGNIENEFMNLPREVLLTVLRTHQKCLMLENAKGNIAPKFIIVANIIPKDNGKSIISGNERVVRARLSDAKFFYETDLKTGIDRMQEKLENRIHHQKIGSMLDKAKRNSELAKKIAAFCDVDKEKAANASLLCKFDLVSEMVNEFPELQGIMGGYYCAQSGHPADIADAVCDHYKPLGPSDSLPTSKLAAVVAIADKLDTIDTLFAINIRPTGSKDPYALRRAAIGIGRIIEHFKLEIPFDNIVSLETIQFIEEKTKNKKRLN